MQPGGAQKEKKKNCLRWENILKKEGWGGRGRKEQKGFSLGDPEIIADHVGKEGELGRRTEEWGWGTVAEKEDQDGKSKGVGIGHSQGQRFRE